MNEEILVGLASVAALGISAQWLAWKTKLPAILVLLAFGIIAGPVTGFLDPDFLMGDLLQPFVSISVAIILFEGGLSLSMSEFRKIGGTVLKLITFGVLITWLLAATAAYFLLDLGLEISVLFGAILIVTGPTVITPLLRQVRPTDTAKSVVKWEGIVNDPIGAMMAVLVFEIIIAGGFQSISGHAGLVIVTTIIDGTFFGALGAGIMYITLKKHWIPDYLQNPVTLMILIAIFTSSNLLQHESGLLAVTIMGIILANQKSVRVKHIVEFKENLQVLLISTLFILLAARLQADALSYINLNSILFLATLFFVVRPVSIYLSTIGSSITFKEKTFIAWMAPRGIVAAAISAIFALRLEQEGYAEAAQLVPYTFIVIIATVTIYGLTAKPVARLLGVAKPEPHGVLFLGAHSWSRKLALKLKELGLKVLVADSNWDNISKARKAGLDTYYGNILSEYAIDEIDLDGIGILMALTPNDEVNSLASIRFRDEFGTSSVFQLAQSATSNRRENDSSEFIGGRTLFSNETNFEKIEEFIEDDDAGIHIIEISEQFSFKEYQKQYFEKSIPIFVQQNDTVQPFSLDNPPTPQPGDSIIALVRSSSEEHEEESTTEEPISED